jgi:pyruvate-formate lyase-activating enzyme
MKRRRFLLVLIKPSHYDDDGYVIQWFRSIMPSNSLAVLHGLARDAARRQVLGPAVDIEVVLIDETNTRVRPARLIAKLTRNNGFGLVGLVGVQSNQFNRALDIARPLRAAGVQVVIGGFHVSGCLAMLPEMQPDVQSALDMGVTVFAGEAEGRLDGLLRDAARRRLAPIYDYLNDLPSMEGAPIPFLMRDQVRLTLRNLSAFDAGRGCPYQCSFCTIINVQGRKSRRRSADDVERIVRQNLAEGICQFFVTDDNLARNKEWEPIFDRLIKLREEEGLRVYLTAQVDTLCHRIPNFVEKAARAGVDRVFIGIDSINPETLVAAKKRQNKITEYRQLLLAWKNVGVIICADYILGFPNDTPESIRRDIEIIKKELPIDIIVFYCLTPLPGSEDHLTLSQKGVWMDPDMNAYDTEHAVTAHPTMSKSQWEDAYRTAWNAYYTPEHCETVLRRAAATNIDFGAVSDTLLYFSQFVTLEEVHPLQGGVFRRKYRADRRAGRPIESIWSFYPKYAVAVASKLLRTVTAMRKLKRICKAIRGDPSRTSYRDSALIQPTDMEIESLNLFTRDPATRDAVKRLRNVSAATAPE